MELAWNLVADRRRLLDAISRMFLPLGQHFNLRAVLLPRVQSGRQLRLHFHGRLLPHPCQLARILSRSLPFLETALAPQVDHRYGSDDLPHRSLRVQLYEISWPLSSVLLSHEWSGLRYVLHGTSYLRLGMVP